MPFLHHNRTQRTEFPIEVIVNDVIAILVRAVQLGLRLGQPPFDRPWPDTRPRWPPRWVSTDTPAEVPKALEQSLAMPYKKRRTPLQGLANQPDHTPLRPIAGQHCGGIPHILDERKRRSTGNTRRQVTPIGQEANELLPLRGGDQRIQESGKHILGQARRACPLMVGQCLGHPFASPTVVSAVIRHDRALNNPRQGTGIMTKSSLCLAQSPRSWYSMLPPMPDGAGRIQ